MPPPIQFDAVLDRRDPASVVTALALDESGERAFVGTSDGVLEEWAVPAGAQRVVLGARRHVSSAKKPVTSLAWLPSARRLAAAVDGAALLLDGDTLAPSPLPGLRGVTAVAAEGGAATGDGAAAVAPARLAVAARGGARGVARAVVYAVAPGAGATARATHAVEWSEALPVVTLAFIGARLVLGTALSYVLWDPPTRRVAPLLSLPPDAPAAAPAALSLPPTPRPTALLVVDQAGVVVGGDGAPVGGGVTYTAPPGAVARVGTTLLAATPAGVDAHDAATGEHGGLVPYPGGAKPAPGQRLYAATAAGGAAALLGGARRVWLVRPVAARALAAAALREGRPAEAAALAAAARHEAWAAAAAAEAGLALAATGDWAAAAPALAAGAAALDGAELLPLFPGEAAPWAAAAVGAARAAEGARKEFQRAAPPLAPLPHPPPPAALAAVADALLACRAASPSAVQAGCDTVAAALLARLGAADRLVALLASPSCRADVPAVAPALTAGGHHLALAALHAAAGDAAAALAVLRRAADGCARADADAARAAAAALLAAPATPPHLVTEAAPWLGGEAASAVLCARADVAARDALALLPPTGPARATYLTHAVLDRGDAALATEAALALVAEAAADGDAAPPLPPARAALARLLDAPALRPHLDLTAVRAALAGTALWREAAAAAAADGDADAAVAVLALTVGDVPAARAAGGGPANDARLLALLLRPPDGRPPLLAAATALAASPDAAVDAGDVVAILPDAAPLADAAPVVSHLLAALTHRRRAAALARGLARAAHLAARADAGAAAARAVRVTPERACCVCGGRIGTRVFGALPDGRLACGRCVKVEEGGGEG